MGIAGHKEGDPRNPQQAHAHRILVDALFTIGA